MGTSDMPTRGLLQELKYDLAGGVGAFVHLAWMSSLRWKLIDRERYEEARKRYGRLIFAFWHGQLLAPAYLGRNWGIRILISQSDDGEYIARLVSHLGFKAVRGSATRGGKAALRKLIRASRRHDLGVTPDGPVGPRHRVRLGSVLLAEATGLPILPMASAARWCCRVGSWDRFEVPIPGSEIAVVAGEPIVMSRGGKDGGRREVQVRLEAALNALTDRAREAVGLPPETE